jgi:hypothetical protein
VTERSLVTERANDDASVGAWEAEGGSLGVARPNERPATRLDDKPEKHLVDYLRELESDGSTAICRGTD